MMTLSKTPADASIDILISASILRRVITLANRANHPSREQFFARTNYDNCSCHQTTWSDEVTRTFLMLIR